MSAASQARSSHPVTSTKKSRVVWVTVVWSPLMMGEREHIVVLVENQWVPAHPLQKVCVFHALGVLQKNIAYGHGLVMPAAQRSGRLQPLLLGTGEPGGKIMNADGGVGALFPVRNGVSPGGP